MTPLSIFRFPQLAYIKIINLMNTAEQIMISQCSRKAYVYVKQYRDKKDTLNLRLLGRYMLCLSNDNKERTRLGSDFCLSFDKPNKKVKISKENQIHFVIERPYFSVDIYTYCTYWEDPLVGQQALLEIILDLFPIDVRFLRIVCSSDIGALQWLQNRQKPIKEVNVQSPGTTIASEDLEYILLNCEAEVLDIDARPSPSFEIKNLHRKFNFFKVQEGRWWVTISNLMTLDCFEIDVSKRFTGSEVNQFLKHWMNGGSPRLQFLEIGVREYNQDEIFADIQNHLTHVPENRLHRSHSNATWTFNGSQLQRNDGVTASIQHIPVLGLIYFGVWPDASGRA